MFNFPNKHRSRFGFLSELKKLWKLFQKFLSSCRIEIFNLKALPKVSLSRWRIVVPLNSFKWTSFRSIDFVRIFQPHSLGSLLLVSHIRMIRCTLLISFVLSFIVFFRCLFILFIIFPSFFFITFTGVSLVVCFLVIFAILIIIFLLSLT